MNPKYLLPIGALLVTGGLPSCQNTVIPANAVNKAFAGRRGAFVVIDCASGHADKFGSLPASRRLPPCSTFKIWNTLIGLETGILKSAEQPFYTWDGKTRDIPEWNKDLNLRAAFQASCVPAFQNLARQIGPIRMESWMDRIGYGDGGTSAGLDVFWLPSPGRKTILISPMEQARLLARLATGDTPFSPSSLATLREIMVVKKTGRGTLYGKTGSGTISPGNTKIGWFVGYVEHQGKTHAFAFVAQGPNFMGTDARILVESLLEDSGFL